MVPSVMHIRNDRKTVTALVNFNISFSISEKLHFVIHVGHECLLETIRTIFFLLNLIQDIIKISYLILHYEGAGMRFEKKGLQYLPQ